MTKRNKPAIAATVPEPLADFAKKQAEARGVSLSLVVSEALELMQVGMVYQLDTRRLISIREEQQKKIKRVA
jgi:hypothetical protein